MTRLEDELRAAAAAERELGRDYEPAVLHSFIGRLDREIDRRFEERLGAQQTVGVDLTAVLLALGSIGMALGVPGAMHDKFGAAATFVMTLIAWVAIVAINLGYARSRRRA